MISAFSDVGIAVFLMQAPCAECMVIHGQTFVDASAEEESRRCH